MILRTHLLTYLGSGQGFGVRLFLFVIGLLLLILTVGPKEVQCHCTDVRCLITPEAENEASSRHILNVRQVKQGDNLKPNEASNASLISVKYMEGGGNDNPKPNIDPKSIDKHTVMPPRPTIDSNSQLVAHASNASVDQIPNEDFAKSVYNLNTAALLRGFYVFGGLGAMVVMYILVRTIRLRRKKTTVRRYGILTNREDLEMTPLGADDDEDTTIFEMSPHTRT